MSQNRATTVTASNEAFSFQSRLDFLGLDAAARERLAGLGEHISRHLPAARDGHRAKVPEQLHRAAPEDRWEAIAAGRLDQGFHEASQEAGRRCAQAGTGPRMLVGGAGIVLEALLKGVVHDAMADILRPVKGRFGRSAMPDAETIQARADALAEGLADMVKASVLDTEIAVAAYVDTLAEEARAREARNGERIEGAAGAIGSVLRSLATGDLTSRVTSDLDPAFDQIKNDTNAVADRLTEIVGQLRTTSRALKTATGEILSGANDLSERTTKQAATIEETSAAVEQLMGAVMQNADQAEQASGVAAAATETAEKSGHVMGEANEAMERITQSSSKISQIVELIDDIAFQTNLLALNASVEAARAGEAGKGFAVVAIEVRRLAQSAAEASRDIKILIEQSVGEVEGGSRLVADAVVRLGEMLTAARSSHELMDAIARGSRMQASSIEEVNTAVRQLDEMTQHNAALVEQTNAAIEQTEAQATELDRIVDVFTLENAPRAEPSVARGPASPPAARVAASATVRPPAKGGARALQEQVKQAARSYLSKGSAALDEDWSEF